MVLSVASTHTDWLGFGGWAAVITLIGGGLAALLLWIGGMRTWTKKTDQLCEKTENILGDIRDKVNQIIGKLDSPVVQVKSPLSLTELGENISLELRAKSWAEEKHLEILEHLRGKGPYEIQGFCFDAVRGEYIPTLPPDFISKEMKRKMQDCAFYRGIALNHVQDVLAIELRNAVLKKLGIALDHPELDK